MTTTTISHADYSSVPAFARVCEKAFAGAAILPSADVMAACLRRGGKRQQPVTVDLLHDGECRSAYRIGGQFGELVVLDATSGGAMVFDLGSSDEDHEAECDAMLAELGV